jgi:hypothetical protein
MSTWPRVLELLVTYILIYHIIYIIFIMKVPSELIVNTYIMFYIHYILFNNVVNLKTLL